MLKTLESPKAEDTKPESIETKKSRAVFDVYHGTRMDFEIHKPGERGIWFTDLPEEANRFTQFGEGNKPNIRPSRISI